MTRQRLRPAWTDDELTHIYAKPHDHRRWLDHHLRVEVTIQVGRWLSGDGAGSAADLSCGNGAILRAMPAQRKIFGDFAPGYRITGPIEKTIDEIGPVGLFVLSETLEHLDDPDAVLKVIRTKTRHLLLSTPVDAWDDSNPEHYFAWSRQDVEDMLAAAGFETVVYNAIDLRPAGYVYQFGVWGCR